MRIVYWGTYDIGKPRNRIIIQGLKENGVQVIECHANVWEGVEDKSQLSGIKPKLNRFFLLLKSYPLLIYRYLRLPPHDVIIVGYMGQFDVFFIWFFAKLRGVPVCWDVFLSLYDTVVIDRKIVSTKSIFAFLLYLLEWFASRAASLLLLDTRAHAQYFEELFRLPPHSVQHVYVGAELTIFKRNVVVQKHKEIFTVLFYGQFIPLHDIDTIVHAAKILSKSSKKIRFVLIGKGQEQPRIDALIGELGIKTIQRISWVNYDKLIDYIHEADICLGIFRASGKATRVIPNKVYQILAASKPLITGDTQAVRELFDENPILRFVEPGNPEALATAILDLRNTIEKKNDNNKKIMSNVPIIGPKEVGRQLVELLRIFNL
jgi:glycosyltransferase involved in cell wall biosynthesis